MNIYVQKQYVIPPRGVRIIAWSSNRWQKMGTFKNGPMLFWSIFSIYMHCQNAGSAYAKAHKHIFLLDILLAGKTVKRWTLINLRDTIRILLTFYIYTWMYHAWRGVSFMSSHSSIQLLDNFAKQVMNIFLLKEHSCEICLHTHDKNFSLYYGKLLVEYFAFKLDVSS